MLLDHLELLVGQRARLVDQRVGDRDLADVVEDPAVAEVLDRRLRQVELAPDVDGQLGDRARVVGRVAVLRLEGRGERLGRPDHRLGELVVEVGGPDRGGEVLGDGGDQLGVELVERALPGDAGDGSPGAPADDQRDRDLPGGDAGTRPTAPFDSPPSALVADDRALLAQCAPDRAPLASGGCSGSRPGLRDHLEVAARDELQDRAEVELRARPGARRRRPPRSTASRSRARRRGRCRRRPPASAGAGRGRCRRGRCLARALDRPRRAAHRAGAEASLRVAERSSARAISACSDSPSLALGEPDAGGQPPTGHLHRADRGPHAVEHRRGLLLGGVREDQRELVAAVAGDHVAGLDARAQGAHRRSSARRRRSDGRRRR